MALPETRVLQVNRHNAGRAIMEVYASTLPAEVKSDGSLVTEADRRAEAVILAALMELAPQIPVVSEENSDSLLHRHDGLFFRVDPLDGTKEFLKRDGKGSFTVSIALVKGDAPVLGIVFAPALGPMFTGTMGRGAHETAADGTVLPLSGRKVKSKATVAIFSPSGYGRAAPAGWGCHRRCWATPAHTTLHGSCPWWKSAVQGC